MVYPVPSGPFLATLHFSPKRQPASVFVVSSSLSPTLSVLTTASQPLAWLPLQRVGAATFISYTCHSPTAAACSSHIASGTQVRLASWLRGLLVGGAGVETGVAFFALRSIAPCCPTTSSLTTIALPSSVAPFVGGYVHEVHCILPVRLPGIAPLPYHSSLAVTKCSPSPSVCVLWRKVPRSCVTPGSSDDEGQ